MPLRIRKPPRHFQEPGDRERRDGSPDIGGILNEIVNAPSLEPFKDLTGEQFVSGAIEDLKRYKLPDYVLQDYLASYAGPRFCEAMAFVRDYPQSLPRLAKRLAEVNVPCQITVGRHDPFVPVSNAEGLHKRLPKSKLDVLDCGHFVWEDAAAEYGKLAWDFIKVATQDLGPNSRHILRFNRRSVSKEITRPGRAQTMKTAKQLLQAYIDGSAMEAAALFAEKGAL